MSRLGLALDSPHLTPELLARGNGSILQTRDGLLRAAVPRPVGTCYFINDLTAAELDGPLAAHREVVRRYPRAATARTCSADRDGESPARRAPAGDARRASSPRSSAARRRASTPSTGPTTVAASAAPGVRAGRRAGPVRGAVHDARVARARRLAGHSSRGPRRTASDRAGAGAGDALGPRRGPGAEDAGARHAGPAGARGRHVHRLLRARDGRGAARRRQVVACEVDADVARVRPGLFRASAGGDKIDIRVGPAQRDAAPSSRPASRSTWSSSTPTRRGTSSYFDAVLEPGCSRRTAWSAWTTP